MLVCGSAFLWSTCHIILWRVFCSSCRSSLRTRTLSVVLKWGVSVSLLSVFCLLSRRSGASCDLYLAADVLEVKQTGADMGSAAASGVVLFIALSGKEKSTFTAWESVVSVQSDVYYIYLKLELWTHIVLKSVYHYLGWCTLRTSVDVIYWWRPYEHIKRYAGILSSSEVFFCVTDCECCVNSSYIKFFTLGSEAVWPTSSSSDSGSGLGLNPVHVGAQIVTVPYF